MEPFFSIIIPTYNRAFIIAETIKSIEIQTFTDWEVLIIDDGSKDNTKQIIEEISKRENKIKYHYQINSERSVARNYGASLAIGQYLLFLDSDDFFKEDHLQNIYKEIILREKPIALFFTDILYFSEKGVEKPEIPRMENGKGFEYVLLNPITPSRVCIHKEIFKTYKFDPEIVIVEDLVLWVCISTRFPVFQVSSYSLYYRMHDGNSVDLSRNSYLSRYKGLKRLFHHKIYKEISKEIPLHIKKFLLAECSFNMARHFEFVKNNKMMVRMLIQSFYYKFNYRNKERLYMIFSKFLHKTKA
jgi:glycosyltransferase involved in cell wall biosynthesis